MKRMCSISIGRGKNDLQNRRKKESWNYEMQCDQYNGEIDGEKRFKSRWFENVWGDGLQFAPGLKNEWFQSRVSSSLRTENRLYRIGNYNCLDEGGSAQMRQTESITAECDAIPRENSGHRIVAKFENCFSVRIDLLGDFANTELLHLSWHFSWIW
jgi:hypothetical protein